MPVQRKIREFLDARGVHYDTLAHDPSYTAGDTAKAVEAHGAEFAKVVMVKLDGKMAMVVLPAFARVKFELLREATGARQVELATEVEFRDLFPGCDVGAMPPFGNLYDMDVWLDDHLAKAERLCFNAGSHREALCMKFEDFASLVPFHRLSMPTPAEPRVLEPA